MRNNVLFGLAACIAASGYFVHNLQKAYAFHGPNINYGANPAVAIGGTAYDGETKTLLTAPADQDILITDISLMSTSDTQCSRTHKSDLMLGSGTVFGQFETGSPGGSTYYGLSFSGLSVQHSLQTGLRIPAGDNIQLVIQQSGSLGYGCSNSASYGVRYMIAGHYVKP